MPESLNWEAELIYRYILTSSQQNQATLLDLYVKLSKDNHRHSTPCLVNTALCLTLMVCLQKSIWEADRNGVDVCDSSQTILPKLEEVLRLSLETSTLQELDYYKETHFWIYFVAAQLEWKTSHNRPAQPVKLQPQKQNAWFSTMLAEQARFLELWKWSDAQETLDLFVINEFWEPHPRLW
ncbi:hypothetical protein H2200_008609 [Cladophialophora chaetospira]|uniref:Uncharacterized protein n=1 Tax=Cladophialophora chaetospira TaxID=386627 RepID=A0AA38X4I4_9EURO|nr:hypothetical protein H2200_008609 [Cladophialophora chaetospira]